MAVLHGPDSTPVIAKVNQVLVFKGLERVLAEEAQAGDIVLVNGVEEIGVGVTLADPACPEALPPAGCRNGCMESLSPRC